MWSGTQNFDAKDKHHLAEVLVGAVFLMAAFKAMTGTEADPDLWGYLAFGRLFWTGGSFPYHDPFGYVPTLPVWVYHEWLTRVLFYPIYQALGAAGLQLGKYGMGLATAGLLYLTARRRDAEVLPTLVVLIVIQGFYVIGYSPVRAQIFTYLFFALTLYLLETVRQSGRWGLLWLLAPLQFFWCNVHGGFLAGLGLIALYAGGEGLRHRGFWPYAASFGLAGLATLINPYGWDYWTYLYRALSMSRPEIGEWHTLYGVYLSRTLGAMWLIYAFLVVGIFVDLAWVARWRELTPILVSGLTLYLGIRHVRHEVFFLLAVGAYAPLLMTTFCSRMRSEVKIPPFFGANCAGK